MWPRDRVRDGEVLRIGALALERWELVDDRLRLLEARPRAGAFDLLAEEIKAVYVIAPKASVTVVLESACAPVIFVDPGATLRTAPLEALVRHRFNLNFSDEIEPPSTWAIRMQRSARKPRVVAYGLPPSLESVLNSLSGNGITWATWCPAFSWGWQCFERLAPKSEGATWWIWPEQDRSIVARVKAGEVIGLHPAVSAGADDAALLRAVSVEAARLGLDAGHEPISVAEWGHVSGSRTLSNGMGWRPVRTAAAASSLAADMPRSAKVVSA